jgi:hypothetical protein
MSIELVDIPTAVADYLNSQVTTTVSPVSSGGSIEDGDIGTFSVTVKNAAAPDGVRLVNVRYHVIVSPPSVAKLSATTGPSSLAPQRPKDDPNAAVLVAGDLVEDYFIFPAGILTESSLDPGETAKFELLEVKGLKKGTATIKCHIHAEIDQASLFPTGENSPNGTHDFSVT